MKKLTSVEKLDKIQIESFFSEALRKVKNIDNCIEFGANIGMNIRALKFLFPFINFDK